MLPPRSDVPLFQRHHMSPIPRSANEENTVVSRVNTEELNIGRQESDTDMIGAGDGAHLFWSGLNYDVTLEHRNKRILNDMYGWIKPGTLTALMVCILALIGESEPEIIMSRELLEPERHHF